MAEAPQIDSKDKLLDLIFDLLDENDAIPWKNDTAYQYLAALAEWLDTHEMETLDWQVLAEALVAAGGGVDYENPHTKL
ncbi:MAG: hypothetical protein L6461_05750 [Anaerolineae bacterium]|nr:hypothetical protein [Anaerolineae bacterium]